MTSFIFTQENSIVVGELFRWCIAWRCIFSSFARSGRGVMTTYFSIFADTWMNTFWLDYRKSYPSKSLSYADYQTTYASGCDHEFGLRYGS
jgi:hypothetical protein